jgi:hypothetical protein
MTLQWAGTVWRGPAPAQKGSASMQQQPSESFTALTVGRKSETEFRIHLHSPVTGLWWQFRVYGNSPHAASLLSAFFD